MFLHSLLNILVLIANKMGLQKSCCILLFPLEDACLPNRHLATAVE
jgi:hypothetical protein